MSGKRIRRSPNATWAPSVAQLDVDRRHPEDLDVGAEVRLQVGRLRHDRDPVRRQRGHELRLRAGDAVDRSDELEVDRADGADHADVRPHDLAEVGDLADAAHPHLDDADLRLRLEPAERQRHAELGVVAPLRPDRRRHVRAERREDVLRRRLPGRAGDADETGAAPAPQRLAEHRHRVELVVRHERGGAAIARRADELAAAADRDEEVARADAARVDLEARDLAEAVQLAEPERLDLLDRERNHACSASRATTRSSNGSFSPATS